MRKIIPLLQINAMSQKLNKKCHMGSTYKIAKLKPSTHPTQIKDQLQQKCRKFPAQNSSQSVPTIVITKIGELIKKLSGILQEFKDVDPQTRFQSISCLIIHFSHNLLAYLLYNGIGTQKNGYKSIYNATVPTFVNMGPYYECVYQPKQTFTSVIDLLGS